MKKIAAFAISRVVTCAFVIAFVHGRADAVPADTNAYVLHPGDVISVSVYGDQTLTQNVTLLPDGTIAYPLIGSVHVGGETVSGATATIRTALKRYLRAPVITVSVVTVGSDDILVLGNVKNPGKYTLGATSRVSDAIAAAGGFAIVNGTYPDARVVNNQLPPITVSLEQLFRKGDGVSDVPLAAQSVVYVEGQTPIAVRVVGAVDHPGDMQVNEGDRLSVAIAQAGASAASHADLSHVRVTRTDAGGHTSTLQYNLYDELKNGTLAADPPLQKNDVVFVPQSFNNDRNLAGSLLDVIARLFIRF